MTPVEAYPLRHDEMRGQDNDTLAQRNEPS